MFLTQYKKQNENTFKKNSKENKCHFTETYNMFENGNFSNNKNDKITQSAMILKDNNKKAIINLGDYKMKKNIKSKLDYKRNHENKFIDLCSSIKNYILDFYNNIN
jgi:hypothetical protein